MFARYLDDNCTTGEITSFADPFFFHPKSAANERLFQKLHISQDTTILPSSF